MRDAIFLASTLFVSLLGAFAFFQIKAHGKSRLWVTIPFAVCFIVLVYLMLLPGPFLFGIVE